MILPLATLTNKEAELVRKFFVEGLFWIFVSLLLILFFSNKDNNFRLMIGGILLISLGIKYLIQNLISKSFGMALIGFMIFSLGILSIATKNLLTIGVDAFVAFSLGIMLSTLALYFLIEKYLSRAGRLIGIVFLVIIGAYSGFVVGPLILTIDTLEKWNPWFFISSVLFVILINFIYYKITYKFIEILGMKNVSFLALSFSSLIFVLYAGYFYLSIASNNFLRDFLLLISAAFITIPTAVSSIRHILENKIKT